MDNANGLSGTVSFTVRPMNTKQMAALYGVCTKTMRRWLQPFKQDIGQRIGKYYSIIQVQVIIRKLGMPSSF